MSEDKFNEMRSDLDFKQMQHDNSVSTSSKLEGELGRRKIELEKINTLDEKIGTELKESAQKMKQMVDDLETYKDLKTLREKSEQRERELSESKKQSEVKSIGMKEKHSAAAKMYNDAKEKLTKDEVAVSLDELELKMRHHEQTVYVLSEYIDTKG
jgi:hypothetical protein